MNRLFILSFVKMNTYFPPRVIFTLDALDASSWSVILDGVFFIGGVEPCVLVNTSPFFVLIEPCVWLDPSPFFFPLFY